MPRFPRNHQKTNYFHVITQGINKSFIFDNPEDIKYYIKNMYEITNKCNVVIKAYCIMNNHAHLLINAESTEQLSKYMQCLNTRFAVYFNKRYKRVGYVFRDRYKSEGIYDEKHLYNCINYIYNNPVKAGICNKPEEYKYSNYKKINYEFDEKYTFIDIEHRDSTLYIKIIERFLIENKINKSQLKNDKIKLKQLIIILKDKYNISFRQMSKLIGISRETIRKIYTK